VGTFKNFIGIATTCTVCPANTYNTLTGRTVCGSQCPNGSVTDGPLPSDHDALNDCVCNVSLSRVCSCALLQPLCWLLGLCSVHVLSLSFQISSLSLSLFRSLSSVIFLIFSASLSAAQLQAGLFGNAVSGVCQPCPVGTFKDAGSGTVRDCMVCPNVTYSNTPGASACELSVWLLSLSVCPSVCLSVCLSVRLSVCLFVCLCLSV
jgi:hypothetical protein